tara:strand:+ start:3166 stop:5133 length:1968 start_codon:yes stop_codon:yes gene_type:complete
MASPKVKQTLMAAAGAAGGAGPNVENLFQTHLYTGNNSTQTITNNIDFSTEGGMLWIKARNDGGGPQTLMDTARGANSSLRANTTGAANTTTSSQDLASFNNNGFSLAQGWAENLNYNNQPYVSHSFRKCPKFFTCLTYTGNGSGTDRTISHDLGSVPGCVIVKRVNGSGDWYVYHRGLNNSGAAPEDQFLLLQGTDQGYNSPYAWNDTAPTATDFTVRTVISNVSGATYVAYLWAHNDGDAEFGNTGNQDIIKCGNFVTDGGGIADVDLGFEPQWIISKKINEASDWEMFDVLRGWTNNTTDGMDYMLRANTSGSEYSGFDNRGHPTATGFRWQYTSSDTYIYIAIRRPMAVPTSGTEVFDIDLANPGSTTITTSFPVDFSLTAKRTGSAGNFGAIDRLRGGRGLRTNSTNAEQNVTVTLDSMNSFFNGAFGSGNHVFYTWKRATSYLAIVAYSGTGSAKTESHSLGVKPDMMWFKKRNSTSNWAVWHKDLTSTTNGYLLLDQSLAESTLSTAWNNTEPTASNFSLGTWSQVNQNNSQFICYLFASAPGVSMVSSYSGNGGTSANGNGQDIDCGFSNGARFVLIKPTNASDNWFVYDTSRGLVAGADATMQLNSTTGESSSSDEIDPLSSGFRILNRNNQLNRTGRNYIFYAIA